MLSNDRVTDVVLVSMGRYPVLKNPFKLVKPLTHKTLDSECVCVCAWVVRECHYLSADCVSVHGSLCLCSLTLIARASGGRLSNKNNRLAVP